MTFEGRRVKLHRMKRALVRGSCLITAVVVGVYLLSWSFGSGGRGLFSPDTLEAKGQSEILLPLTRLPLYRSSFRYYRYKLVDYLMEKRYWTPRLVDRPRWISMFQWNEQWRDGYSRLYYEIRQHLKWIEWSETHPELAAVLWPWVLEVLRNESRDKGCASELMFQARLASSVADFQRSIESDVDLLAVCPDILSYAPHMQKRPD